MTLSSVLDVADGVGSDRGTCSACLLPIINRVPRFAVHKSKNGGPPLRLVIQVKVAENEGVQHCLNGFVFLDIENPKDVCLNFPSKKGVSKVETCSCGQLLVRMHLRSYPSARVWPRQILSAITLIAASWCDAVVDAGLSQHGRARSTDQINSFSEWEAMVPYSLVWGSAMLKNFVVPPCEALTICLVAFGEFGEKKKRGLSKPFRSCLPFQVHVLNEQSFKVSFNLSGLDSGLQLELFLLPPACLRSWGPSAT